MLPDDTKRQSPLISLIITSLSIETARFVKDCQRLEKGSDVKWMVLAVSLEDLVGIDRTQEAEYLIEVCKQRNIDLTLFDNYLGKSDLVKFLGKVKEEQGGLSRLYTPRPRIFRLSEAGLIHHALESVGENVLCVSVPYKQQFSPSAWLEKRPVRLGLDTVLWPIILNIIAYLLSELSKSFIPQIFYNLNSSNIAMIFLTATVMVAYKKGFIAGLISSLLGFFILNYYHTIPYERFNFDAPVVYIEMIVFFFASISVALVGGSANRRLETAVSRERNARVLYQIVQRLNDVEDIDAAITQFEKELKDIFNNDIKLYCAEEDFPLENADSKLTVTQKALSFSRQNMKPTGYGCNRYSALTVRFQPIVVQNKVLGVAEIPRSRSMSGIEFSRLCRTLCGQFAIIVENILLAQDLTKKELDAEREKTRSLLLSSISHDLKTPLASIVGSLSVYKRCALPPKNVRDKPDQPEMMELIDNAIDEAQRLNGFISNILQMTKINAGGLDVQKNPCDPYGLVEDVLSRMDKKIRQFDIKIDNKCGDEYCNIDELIFCHILQNLLENAAKYASSSKEITIELDSDPENFMLTVSDQGPGIPQENSIKIFDPHERLNHSDHQAASTGLGLAICKAMAELHGGTISVTNNTVCSEGSNSGAAFKTILSLL